LFEYIDITHIPHNLYFSGLRGKIISSWHP
jgi:hypothetical protein